MADTERRDARSEDARAPRERMIRPTTGDDDRDRALADQGEPVAEVTVLVCVECGREYPFEGEPPDELVCDRCGNGVFRSFSAGAPGRGDEAEDDFQETTERDLAADSSGSDVEPGDLQDLNNP